MTMTKYLFAALILFPVSLYSQTGFITGKVTDSGTNEPLAGVNIIVNELKNTVTVSSIEGDFLIKVPVGSYSVKASLIGYTTIIKTDVIVKTGKEARLSIQLPEGSLQLDEVSIKADYFDRAVMENSLSTITLGAEEVKRSPGSLQDFQRILQSLAGVSFSKDKTNELLVRGGSPEENLTVLDNMEIHSTNHFPNERNSGGPVNMINVDLIEDIRFSTGGFISKYGDKLSSVMNITMREGSRLKPFKANLNLSIAGLGAIAEGAFDEDRGSWIVSLRKSYMDLIKGPVGLSSVPEYYDIQFKLAYDISLKHKLTVSGIYGNDKNFTEGEAENRNVFLAGSMDSVSLFVEHIKQYQYAAGSTLRSIWSKNLFSLLTLYYSSYNFNNSETEQFTARIYDAYGDVFQSYILKNKLGYEDKSRVGSLGLKYEFTWSTAKTNELSFGAALKSDEFRRDVFMCGDSSRYDILSDGWNTPDDIYVRRAASETSYRVRLFDNQKSYAYLNDRISIFEGSLIFNLGLRYDYFTYSKKGNLSPRVSATWNLFHGSADLNFAYGEYYQTQSYPTYTDRYQSEVNRYLSNTHARHIVMGYNQILDEGMKLTIEGYIKKYYDIPVREDYIHSNDRTFRSEKYLNAGRQAIYGIDLLIQQKLVKNFYGIISYSRMWSKTDDPRIGKEGQSYPSDHDYPHIFTVILGRRCSSLRDYLDRAPFYIKYPSYLLPFSNDMEISARWRYASGRLYTPRLFVTTEQFYEGDSRWSHGSWISGDERNSERYPDYHRLDISFSSRFNFTSWSLSVYLSIENLYNRKNVASYQYNSDGTRETSIQYSLLPVVGLEVEF